MEPLTVFALTIGFIGVFHLLSTAVNRFGKGIYTTGNQKNKREDWYCFFKISALLGKDWEGSKKDSDRHVSRVESEKREQRRRQQAKRPRLHV